MTLYISFHQDGRTLYPGTGFPDEAGSPAAWGTNINLPLLPGTGDEGLHRLYDGLIQHILDDFEPELIIIQQVRIIISVILWLQWL